MHGPFAVQEYLQELIRKQAYIIYNRLSKNNLYSLWNQFWWLLLIIYIGNDPSSVKKICEPPKEVDEAVW